MAASQAFIIIVADQACLPQRFKQPATLIFRGGYSMKISVRRLHGRRLLPHLCAVIPSPVRAKTLTPYSIRPTRHAWRAPRILHEKTSLLSFALDQTRRLISRL